MKTNYEDFFHGFFESFFYFIILVRGIKIGFFELLDPYLPARCRITFWWTNRLLSRKKKFLKKKKPFYY